MSWPYSSNHTVTPSNYKSSSRSIMGAYGSRLLSTNSKSCPVDVPASPLNTIFMNSIDYKRNCNKFDNWKTTENNPHSQVILRKKESNPIMGDYPYNISGNTSTMPNKISEQFLSKTNESENLTSKKPSRFLRSSVDIKPEKKLAENTESNPITACVDKMAKLKMLLLQSKSITSDNNILKVPVNGVINIVPKTNFGNSSNECSPFTSLNDNSLEIVNIDYPSSCDGDSNTFDSLCDTFEALNLNNDDNKNCNIMTLQEISNDTDTNALKTNDKGDKNMENSYTCTNPDNIKMINCADIENISNNSVAMIPHDISKLDLIETTSPLTPESEPDYEDEFDECLETENKQSKHFRMKKRKESNKKSDKNKCDINNSTVKTSEKNRKHKKNKRNHRSNVFTIDECDHPVQMENSKAVEIHQDSLKLLYKTKPLHRKQNKRRSTNCIRNKINEYISLLIRNMPHVPKINDKPVHFDEINGKFVNSSSCDTSEDEFTVVFSDNVDGDATRSSCRPSQRKVKYDSECDSDDSFVICFDSDCEVDGGYKFQTESSDSEDESSDEDTLTEGQTKRLKGCMKKPRSRGSSPPDGSKKKKVSFDTAPPKIHRLIAWSYAYKQARIGNWQKFTRDAERFKQRIMELSVCLDVVLRREHRNRIFFQRFRPILMRQEREEREAAKLKQKQDEAANNTNNELIAVS